MRFLTCARISAHLLIRATLITITFTVFSSSLHAQSSTSVDAYYGQYIIKRAAHADLRADTNPFSGLATTRALQAGDYELIELNLAASGGVNPGDIVPLNQDEADSWCQFLSAQTQLTHCEPNVRWDLEVAPQDTLYSELYGMKAISMESAWEHGVGSKNVVVAVTDTGVDYTHPDLAQNIWVNADEIPDNGIDDDGNGYIDDRHGIDTYHNDSDPMDDHGHGTHCAGTIGGKGDNQLGVAGVNWNVSIMPLKFLGAGGGGSTLDAITLIDYAVNNGADVINASWGGYFASQALKEAIMRARDAGVIFVAAAGNSASNNDGRPHYPSNYALSNVISVAATDENDNLTYFSNYGPTTVHVAAPGMSILSTYPGGSYRFLSGTSMAAPHVAGLAGLLRSIYPDEPYTDTVKRILNGDPLASLSGMILTARRVNAYKSITGGTDGEVPGSTSVNAEYFGSDLKPSAARVYKNRPFTALFSGTPGTIFNPTLTFAGSFEEPCSLGQFVIGVDGFLTVKGRLLLAGVAKRWTRKVLLHSGTIASQTISRKVRSARKQSNVRKNKRKVKSSRVRVEAAVSRSCQRIRSAMSFQ